MKDVIKSWRESRAEIASRLCMIPDEDEILRATAMKMGGLESNITKVFLPKIVRHAGRELNADGITQMLIEKIGPLKAVELFPLNINPDDPSDKNNSEWTINDENINLNIFSDNKIKSFLDKNSLEIGSNNWAVNAELSPGNKPVVSNDPHLDARKLPGPWYPSGIFCPEFRSVGVTIPGIPGMIIGRTDYFAIGVTNAYGDTQDLYVETIDPDNPERYLEGKNALKFKVMDEIIKIKDKDA